MELVQSLLGPLLWQTRKQGDWSNLTHHGAQRVHQHWVCLEYAGALAECLGWQFRSALEHKLGEYSQEHQHNQSRKEELGLAAQLEIRLQWLGKETMESAKLSAS